MVRFGLDSSPAHGTALERWLHVRFGTPERFATLLLTHLIAERDPETATALRFLDEATVPDRGWADLAVDRQVLLEQATPWHYFDRTSSPALAALAAWRRRYETAYARHYAAAREEAEQLSTSATRLLARAATADRLATIFMCEGRLLAPQIRNAIATLGALPPTPLSGTATTVDICLSALHPAVEALERLKGGGRRGAQRPTQRPLDRARTSRLDSPPEMTSHACWRRSRRVTSATSTAC